MIVRVIYLVVGFFYIKISRFIIDFVCVGNKYYNFNFDFLYCFFVFLILSFLVVYWNGKGYGSS